MGEESFDVAVIGGGPGGAACAALLARRHRRVLLLEGARFPRYHIGESLIPGAIQVLRELGVLDEIDGHGFVVKRGNTYVWGQGREPWSVAFAEANIAEYSYQVVRSEFDAILLRHAARSGVDVREQHTVEEVAIDGDGRCRGVQFVDAAGVRSTARARWTVDASGRNCLIGRRLGLRRPDPVLDNVAIWGYWQGAARLPEPRSGDTLSAATEDGWIWYIPLHDGSVSIGVVFGVEALRRAPGRSLDAHYHERLAGSELVRALTRGARFAGELQTTRDWSYRCERVAGPGWILVGDAAGFVDPILSTGCGLALQAASAGADAIDLALGGVEEARVIDAYADFYHRYLGQFFDFVHYFYDANRHVDSYYWQARKLLDPARNDAARESFIYLIAGLNHSNTDEPRKRSFQMGVFDNLGTPLGGPDFRFDSKKRDP